MSLSFYPGKIHRSEVSMSWNVILLLCLHTTPCYLTICKCLGCEMAMYQSWLGQNISIWHAFSVIYVNHMFWDLNNFVTWHNYSRPYYTDQKLLKWHNLWLIPLFYQFILLLYEPHSTWLMATLIIVYMYIGDPR